MDGKTQAAAAAAAGMSLRTAREWDSGPAPSATKQPRDWRTRPDPFAAVWLTEIEPLLQRDTKGVLEAKFVLETLLRASTRSNFSRGRCGRCSGAFATGGRCTGRSPRCTFQQVAVPGREAAIDFTHATELGVTIAGVPFPHLLFEFVLSYSGWTWASLAFGETFEALVAGRPGRAVGARRRAGGAAQRQSVGGDPRAEAQQRARSDGALPRGARALRDAIESHHARAGARKRRRRAGATAREGARRAGAARARAMRTSPTRRRTRRSCRRSSTCWRNRPAAARLAEERRRCGRCRPRAIPSYTSYDADRAAVEHDSRGAPHLLGAGAADGPHGRSARAIPTSSRSATAARSSRRCRGCAKRTSTASTTAT